MRELRVPRWGRHKRGAGSLIVFGAATVLQSGVPVDVPQATEHRAPVHSEVQDMRGVFCTAAARADVQLKG